MLKENRFISKPSAEFYEYSKDQKWIRKMINRSQGLRFG